MGAVTLTGVRKDFGALQVIKGIELDVADGEFIVFVGPSGCGKSTLLRMIAGLEDVDLGTITIDGQDVTELAPARRGVAMVFQNYALYPHMSAYENMAYGLRRAGMAPADVDVRVRQGAKMLQIESLLDRRPKAMSGGQRQRVAIGRAIVRQPKVFLFDEPLSNLDASLRVEMRAQIARLHRQLRATIIFVTHDQVEAMTLADRIVVMNGGQVEQVGTPRDVFHAPRNVFVAGFIGSPAMNLLPAMVRGGHLVVAGVGALPMVSPPLPDGMSVTLGFRPEVLRPDPAGPLTGEITLVEHLGGETIIHLVAADLTPFVARVPDDLPVEIGQRMAFAPDLAKAHLFDSDGNRILRG